MASLWVVLARMTIHKWGATLAGAVYVWRSGVGITADGALVYVAGPDLNITDLANVLAARWSSPRDGARHQYRLGELQFLQTLFGGRDRDPCKRIDASAQYVGRARTLFRVLVGQGLLHALDQRAVFVSGVRTVREMGWARLFGERESWLWFRPPPRARFLAGWSLLPLRVFLGWTFLFAGLQKLSNPSFFDASNPASIQAQLAGAERRSPIHSLLTHLGHFAVPIGIIIALGEIAVGLGTLLGLRTRMAAVGGLLISFSLFLVVSFHSNPYYTGSDIVFVFAWLPLVIAGSGNMLSLDGAIENATRYRRRSLRTQSCPFRSRRCDRSVDRSYKDHAPHGAMHHVSLVPARTSPRLAKCCRSRKPIRSTGVYLRPRVLRQSESQRVGVVVAGVSAGLGRAMGGVKTSSTKTLGAEPGPSRGAQTTVTTRGARTSPTTNGRTTPGQGGTPPGSAIGLASQVPLGGAAQFGDPRTGDPSLVIQPQAGKFLAFDAICPHAGCTVQYAQGEFVCPCHGSVFNGTTGAVLNGPAQSGLAQIPIAEGSDGKLYVD